MESKQLLENIYRTNYDAALQYAKQNNLVEMKNSLKKALEAIIKLMETSFGTDRNTYRAKGEGIKQLLVQINQKIESAPKQSTGNSGGNSGGSDKDKKAPEKPPAPPKVSVEDALAELFDLEGLAGVKKEVKTYVDLIQTFQRRKQAGLPVPPISYHMVFMGNPGTGKTTVARIMAKIFHSLGIVENGHLVEVARKDLVAGYVGQTAKLTQEVIEKSIGGVLFIDEAYTLAPKKSSGNDFGQEAIDTLLAEMENRRSDFVVIVAGYDDLMNDFIDSNPGLQSRFKNYINFTDYNGEEMFRIFSKMCEKNKYVPSPEAREMIKTKLNDLYEHRGPNFANARDVRKMFEKTVEIQATRMARIPNASAEILMQILPEDIPQK